MWQGTVCNTWLFKGQRHDAAEATRQQKGRKERCGVFSLPKLSFGQEKGAKHSLY